MGCTLGVTEGVNVGRRVGRSVGAAMGLVVLVGPLVLGWLLGCGEIDGALVLGCEEGALEGFEEGTSDGAAVGFWVGTMSVTTKALSSVAISRLFFVTLSRVALKATRSAEKTAFPSRTNPAGRREKDNSWSVDTSNDCSDVSLYCTEHAILIVSSAEVMSVQTILALYADKDACWVMNPVDASIFSTEAQL